MCIRDRSRSGCWSGNGCARHWLCSWAFHKWISLQHLNEFTIYFYTSAFYNLSNFNKKIRTINLIRNLVFATPNNYNSQAFTRSESRFLNRQVIENDNRPVNLNLLTISLPIIGVSSILHRISGVAIFFSFPLVVWMLSISLKSEESYSLLSSLFQSSTILKIMIYLFLVGFSYHLLAGFKKLLSDAFGIGETLASGRILSWIVFGATFLMAVLFIFYIF